MDADSLSISSEDTTLISSVSSEILSDWGMMLIESVEGENVNMDDFSEGFVSTLRIKGDNAGVINVFASRDFANNLYSNLSGEFGAEVNDSDLMDCLKEMTNVFSGSLVSKVFGETKVFDLSDLSCEAMTEEILKSIPSIKSSVFCLGDDSIVGFSVGITS